jgi:peptide/nickel transport system substrate-binding protein
MDDIGLGILPKHLLENTPDMNEDAVNQHPIGTGPFTFVEWVKDDHVTLQAFDKSWRGRPNVDRWIWKPLKDKAALLAQLKTGEVDVAAIEPGDLTDIKSAPNISVYPYFSPSMNYLGYNTRKPGLDDVKVRQALAHALDRKLIIDKVLLGEGRAIDSDQPPDSWAYSSDVTKFEFNPDKARQLLDAAGWIAGPGGVRQKNGQSMKYSLWTNSGVTVREAIVTIAQQQYKDVGVEVELQFQDFASFINRLNKLDFDMFVSGFSFGADPDNYGLWHSTRQPDPATGKEGFNRVGFSTSELDTLTEQARTLPGCDQATRKDLYAQIQRLLADNQPWNFLHQTKSLAAVNKRLVGVDPTPWGGILYNVREWSVS